MSIFEKENFVQSKALKILSKNNSELMLKFVMYNNMIIAEIFRNIINEFESKNNFPNEIDLINITSDRLNLNLQELFN